MLGEELGEELGGQWSSAGSVNSAVMRQFAVRALCDRVR